MIKSAPPRVRSDTVHNSSALSRVVWELASYHWVAIATTTVVLRWKVLWEWELLVLFFFFSSWWWRGLCIQTVFNSGRLSVIPREQQHLQHLSSSQKCKFWSLIPDLPASAALGVGLGHLRLNETLKVRLRCARLRSRAMDLPAAFPLSDPHQPARGRGILETQHLGLHPRSTESD